MGKVTILAVVIAILMVRPQGLFAKQSKKLGIHLSIIVDHS